MLHEAGNDLGQAAFVERFANQLLSDCSVLVQGFPLLDYYIEEDNQTWSNCSVIKRLEHEMIIEVEVDAQEVESQPMRQPHGNSSVAVNETSMSLIESLHATKSHTSVLEALSVVPDTISTTEPPSSEAIAGPEPRTIGHSPSRQNASLVPNRSSMTYELGQQVLRVVRD